MELKTAMPRATMASAVTTRTPTRSRARRDMGLCGRHPQPVAAAPDGVDERWLDAVELLAQVRDVRLDDVGVASEVVLPDVIEDLGLGEHSVRVQHEIAEQLE